MIELRASVDREVEARLSLERELIYQKCKSKIAEMRQQQEKRESELKAHFESQARNQVEVMAKRFKNYMESQVSKINLVVSERISEYIQVRGFRDWV